MLSNHDFLWSKSRNNQISQYRFMMTHLNEDALDHAPVEWTQRQLREYGELQAVRFTLNNVMDFTRNITDFALETTGFFTRNDGFLVMLC